MRDKTASVIKEGKVDAAIAQKLVDQAIMTVAGKIDPRNSVSARLVRENKEKLRELMQELKAEEQGE